MDGFVAWPQEFEERYITEGYWKDKLLGDLLDGVDPKREALVCDGERLTYGELERRIERTAAGLLGLGLRKGDHVVVQLPNSTAFVVGLLALVRIGVLPVLALPAHRESEISYLCELTGARAYLVPDVHGGYDHRELARKMPVEFVIVDGEAQEFVSFAELDADPIAYERPSPGDVALFLLSGGTTGLPKLIARTHRDYVYNYEASAEVCGFGPETVYLVVLPAAHNFALACPGIFGTLGRGGKVVLAPSGAPDAAFPLIEAERVSVCAVVPPIALLWLDAVSWSDEDLSSLQVLQVGGAKFAAERAVQVPSVLGCRVQQVFGMAEGLLNYTRLDDPDELVAISQGRPMSPADEVRVVDSEGGDVPQGEVGELLTRGPYTLRGYYRAPEHNARSFTPDGFYRTGDLVRRLASGHLIVEGRAKDQINRGGDKVAAEELENHLLAHPAVHDAAAVGMADPVMGERTCVFLIVREGAIAPTPKELKEFLKDRGLAAYKFPDRVETIDVFPRTPVGKVSKKRLAALLG